MLDFLKPQLIPPYLKSEIERKFCYINNMRAKYFTIALVIYSLFISSYDVLFNQSLLTHGNFIIQFKLDIVLIVFSVIFTLYIYFNQTKSAKNIREYHKSIHFIISLTTLCWFAAKASLSSFEEEIVIQLYIIAVFLTSIVFYFSFYKYVVQILISICFFIIIALFFEREVSEIFKSSVLNLVLIVIAFLISRILYHQKTEFFMKEYEVSRLKEEKNFSNGKK